MLKNISNLGKALKKAEQKAVNGGNACFSCYNNCMHTNTNKDEYGVCISLCQQNIC